MRQYAQEWVRATFDPGAQAAIIGHNDNKERLKNGLEGIPHAHIILNAVNTKTGNKWQWDKSELRRHANVAQRLAYKYSLSAMPELVAERSDGYTYSPTRSAEVVRTKAEIGLIRAGKFCYKENIRTKVSKAAAHATSLSEFEKALADYAITVKTTEEGLFTYRDSKNNPANETGLGTLYGKELLTAQFLANFPKKLKENPFGEATPINLSMIRNKRSKGSRIYAPNRTKNTIAYYNAGGEKFIYRKDTKQNRYHHLDNTKALALAISTRARYQISAFGPTWKEAIEGLNNQLIDAAAKCDSGEVKRINDEIKIIEFSKQVL